MKEKVLPLTQGDLTAAEQAYNLWASTENKIANRVSYIIRTIAKIFGGKIEWWDWKNGGGEVNGHFEFSMLNGKEFQLDGSKKGGEMDWVSTLKEGEWEFTWLAFPTRFIWEDFEDEVRNGIEKFKESERINAEKEKLRKQEKLSKKQQLLESAKSKLTKEELKALMA